MKILVTIVILVLMTVTVEAQDINGVVAVDGYHSSTAAEGYLRGQGAALIGAGRYLEGLGNYQNLHQMARRRAYDNWENAIRTQRLLKDDYKARQLRDNPPWAERRMRQLDKIEDRAAVRQREDKMRAAGLLPQKKEAFGHKGVHYKNYSEFKSSPAFQDMLAAKDARDKQYELEKIADKNRYDSAVKFFANRSRMNPISRIFHDEKVSRNEKVRRIMGDSWWNKHLESQ